MGFAQEPVEVELAAHMGAPRLARRIVGKATATLPGDLAFRAQLAASELVANSVTHGLQGSDKRVRLNLLATTTGVRVEVRDGGAAFASEARQAGEWATSGRGLRLVDVLVDRWGIEREDDGNLAWFEIYEHIGGEREPRTSPTSGTTVEQGHGKQTWSADEQTVAAALLARAAQRVRVGWCQNADATDASGTPIQPWSEQAAAWSLLGALVASLDGPDAVPELPLPILATAMEALAVLIDDHSLSGWNDAPSRTQRDVVTVLERARTLIRSGRVTT
jgi:anti-sigma regulatory factor (Ser/Thr protein kinase)